MAVSLDHSQGAWLASQRAHGLLGWCAAREEAGRCLLTAENLQLHIQPIWPLKTAGEGDAENFASRSDSWFIQLLTVPCVEQPYKESWCFNSAVSAWRWPTLLSPAVLSCLWALCSTSSALSYFSGWWGDVEATFEMRRRKQGWVTGQSRAGNQWERVWTDWGRRHGQKGEFCLALWLVSHQRTGGRNKKKGWNLLMHVLQSCFTAVV